MATATVRKVIGAAARLGETADTDGELLRRFASDGDQQAFAALVKRHTNLVLGVCRRSLASVTDAEDATQAVFVVLAKKAKSGRWQASIVNWLYTTARRVSKDARIAAARRAQHEGNARRPGESSPLDQMSGRELLAAIDDELDRLSALYREPLVLSFLEGLSREDVATRLGLPPATVKTRLERGRKKLADALTKRGVGLGSALLALASTSLATATSPRLLDSILASATGHPSAAVAALAQGVAVGTWKSKAVLAVAVLFGLTVTTTVLTTNVGAQVRPTPKADVPKPAADTGKAEEKPTVVTGTVVGPDGKPVAGASLRTLKLDPAAANGLAVELGMTDANGKFSVLLTRPAAGHGFPLVAAKDGYGPDWVTFNEVPDAGLHFKLVADDVTVKGRVTDLEGKGVPKAVIRLTGLATTPSGDLAKVWEQWPRSPYLALRAASKDLWLPTAAGFPEAVTADADGKFELKGFGRSRLVGLKVEGPGIETAGLRVVTDTAFDPRKVEQPNEKTMPGGSFQHGPPLYGPTFTHVGKPSQPVKGVVTDAATGKPLAGIQVFGTSADPRWQENHASTMTDADGRFTVLGIAKSSGVRLSVFPGEKAPYFHYQTTVAGKPGLTEITAELKLTRGVLVKGRVVERGTGKPVFGAGVRYAALADNIFHAALMKGKRGEHGMAWTTDADGRFQFVALPGSGIVTAQGETRGRERGTEFTQVRIRKEDLPRSDRSQLENLGELFLSADGHFITMHSLSGYAMIDPKPTDTEVNVEIVFDRGQSVVGKVLTPDGKPAAGVTAYQLTACYDSPQKLKDGTFTAIALEPDHPRLLLFADTEKKLAASVELKGDEKDVTLKLEPWGRLTGRLLDADGKPLAGASVSAHPRNHIRFMAFSSVLQDRKVTTDAAGRFVIDVPGGPAEYQLGFGWKNQYLDVGLRADSKGYAVKAGGTTDAGEFRAKGE